MDFFADNFINLRSHWSDQDRAKKFQKGGTRAEAVDAVLRRIEPDIHTGSYLDVATGAGYVQTRISPEVAPFLHVGLDFSIAMLQSHKHPYGERVCGSAFNLPFRKGAFSIITTFFCLSDYPMDFVKEAVNSAMRCLQPIGTYGLCDYSKRDGYWIRRQKLHGQIGSDGKKIIGNIHLRLAEDILPLLPPEVRHYQQLLEYEVEAGNLGNLPDSPPSFVRSFYYIEAYKPRIN